jgi:hypothetical protein
METLKTIPPEVVALIPCDQLYVTKGNIKEFQDGIKRLEAALQKCPNIGETYKEEEHPAIFHYFFGSTDIYICEYDHENFMYGHAIISGDLKTSAWGFFFLSELTNIRQFNLDYHFAEQSIEAALHKSYPDHFSKPQSLM